MKSRSDSQMPLPPMEVRTSNQGEASVRKSHQGSDAVGKSDQNDREAAEALAATIFDRALESAGISRDEAAYLMGQISRSMVDQMCSTSVPKAPSLIQLLLLPPSFHLALIKQLDAHFGLGRSVLAQVQQAVGTLALLVR